MEAKFCFVPAYQAANDKKTDIEVSFNTKTGRVIFSRLRNPEVVSLIGKWVKTHVDIQHKRIGWVFLDKGKDFSVIKGVKQITANKVSGSVGFVDKNLIKGLKINGQKTYTRMVVKRYRDQSKLENAEYFYVDLTEDKVKKTRQHA